MTDAPSADPRLRLQQAVDLLRLGRPIEAIDLLRQEITARPASADGHRLLGMAHRDLGQLAEAEAELRMAYALQPDSDRTAIALSELLLDEGRPEEALQVIAPLAASPTADLHTLTAAGLALKALRRWDEAVETLRRGTIAAPVSAVAEHNLAGALGDAERFPESEAAARRAFDKGLDAPETWLVHARALLGQGRHDDAERAYRETIRRRADLVDAQGELAQLVWMRNEDVASATAVLDEAIAAYPHLQALQLKKAELLEYAVGPGRAYAALAEAVARPGAEPLTHVVAARLSMMADPARAVLHGKQAAALSPDDPTVLGALCQAYLAAGEIDLADGVAAELRRRSPLDQHALGLQATIWRLTGDPRLDALVDYDRFVGAYEIDTPAGWSSLTAFLGDLRESLMRLHTLRTHPIGQSVRHGSQTSQSLTRSDDPTIRSFFQAVDGPIRRHLASLGPGDDPVRSRMTAGYRLNGAWSVRLRPGGFHVNHLHSAGWFSSAFYVAVPEAVDHDREGWLKFGEPGIATKPALSAEHFVKPRAGQIVLFPSYMWHGTVPFAGDAPRLSIAFDLLPA